MSEPTEDVTVDALLAPFEGDRPAGEDIRRDASPQSLYYRLRDARAEARAAERAADNDPALGDAPPPQWAEVRSLAIEALSTLGKDAEVACWLTESLTRRHGLSGLAAGSELLAGLIEGFWFDGLFPAEEQDDPEARLAAVTGLSGQDRDGSLLQPLRKTVLFERPDGTPVTLWDYERSANLVAAGGAAEAKSAKAKSAKGVMSFVELEVEARGTGLAMLRTLDRTVARAGAGWKQLEDTIARTVAAEAQPSTGRVRGVLETLRQMTARYVPADTPPDEAAAAEPEAAGMPAEARGTILAPAADRDALLDEILRIAALFRRSEPNAPLGFTLEEAVRRARLPWPDLLRELVADAAARTRLMTSVGMRPEGATASEEQS